MQPLRKVHLRDYVQASADLAESVAEDIKKGKKISNNTIVALNMLVLAAQNVSTLVDMLENDPDARTN